MKKVIMALVTGILLIGVNAYAAGDLQVNGSIGVGAEPTGSARILVDTIDQVGGRFLVNTTGGGNYVALAGQAQATANIANKMIGLSFVAIDGANSLADQMIGTEVIMQYNNTDYSSPPASLTSMIGASIFPQVKAIGIDYNVDTYRGVYLRSPMNQATTGNIATFTNWYNIYVEDPALDNNVGGDSKGIAATNAYGLYIEGITGSGIGTATGIALVGDGAGSDIVFGASQQASIYSENGFLYATDKTGNITQFSPHDPETGEWIYYSENTKTGVVKRVNMEKLVKAVEKLTGETFMVETLLEK